MDGFACDTVPSTIGCHSDSHSTEKVLQRGRATCVGPLKIVGELKFIALEADSSSFFIRFCSYSGKEKFFHLIVQHCHRETTTFTMVFIHTLTVKYEGRSAGQ